jgi:hypothetical protein
MMTATSRKPTFSRSKIYYTQWSNGLGYNLTDWNKCSRSTAEILLTVDGKSNCRIDRNGQPWKYAKDIPSNNPMTAYEYTLQFGDRCEE